MSQALGTFFFTSFFLFTKLTLAVRLHVSSDNEVQQPPPPSPEVPKCCFQLVYFILFLAMSF